MNMEAIVESLLLRSAVLFLMVGSVAGLAAGALLLWQPQRLSALGAVLNSWVSTRNMDTVLERSVTLEPWFYRHHRIVGAITLLASAYVIYFFTLSHDGGSTVRALAREFDWPAVVVSILLDALVLSLVLGALLAAFVSLYLMIRPSLLRGFEQGANRWLSLRRAMKPLEIPRQGVDELVFKHRRQAGILLVLGSLYTLAMLTLWLDL
jgi:hypothetical protein